MAGFRFRLYVESGDDLGTFTPAVPDWHIGQELFDRTRTRYRIENIVWNEDLPGDDFHAVRRDALKLAEP